jgi:cobalt-zinc-cadmium efflux system protein
MSRHEHHHHSGGQGKRLLATTLLNLSITVVQVVGGIISGSLSLLSDALHGLGDALALFIAYIANKISRREANLNQTFGYKRVEILAALFNAVTLIAICIFLFVEAYERLLNPSPIKGGIMLAVASFGLLANLVSVLILERDKNHNLNVKAAYFHLLGDTLSSVAVIAGGVAIVLWNITWIDPLITIAVGIYIIYSSWDVLRQTVGILMQQTPQGIDIEQIKREAENLPEVENLHHVHVWQLNDQQIHFEGHITLSSNLTMDSVMLYKKKVEEILQKHGIEHTVLQFEYGGYDNRNLIECGACK